METHSNPLEQQRQAKLNLLSLDDDCEAFQQNQNIDLSEHWGRSLETQSYLKEKLSQRYKQKRKSYRQLRSRTTLNQQCKHKKPFINDKQSLKDILKKLQSKELKPPSNMSTLRNSSIVEFKHPIKERNLFVKNQSNRSNKEPKNSDNSTLRKGLKQLLQNTGQNNFFSKKIDILSNKKINLNQNCSILAFENENFEDQKSSNTYETCKTREYFTETKQERKMKRIFRKNTENKENQVLAFLEFPLDSCKNSDFIRNTVFISKKDKNLSGLVQNQEINKRTFQILQEINRTKSINNAKKLTSQSLKLKKPQMCPYSRVLKDRSNIMEDQNKLKSTYGTFVKNNNSDSIWVKLEIRK